MSLSQRFICVLLVSKHVLATKGFSAWGSLVTSIAVPQIVCFILCPLVVGTESPLLLILFSFPFSFVGGMSAFYFGVARHLPHVDSARKRWCALLIGCFPQTIGEPFYNHLCEMREMMYLQGCSKSAIGRETVRQLISLFVIGGTNQVLDRLLPIKKPKID
jgi:hypothetical protein